MNSLKPLENRPSSPRDTESKGSSSTQPWGLFEARKTGLDNRNLVLDAFKKGRMALRDASEELRGDREVVLAAVAKNGFALNYASEELRGDKDFMLDTFAQYRGGLDVHDLSSKLKIKDENLIQEFEDLKKESSKIIVIKSNDSLPIEQRCVFQLISGEQLQFNNINKYTTLRHLVIAFNMANLISDNYKYMKFVLDTDVLELCKKIEDIKQESKIYVVFE